MEGWATRGRFAVEIAYVWQYGKCEKLIGCSILNLKEFGDNLYKTARRWQVNILDMVVEFIGIQWSRVSFHTSDSLINLEF